MLIFRLCYGGSFIVLCHSALTIKSPWEEAASLTGILPGFLKGVRVILILGCVVTIVIVGILLAGEVDYHLPPRARRRNLEKP
jgi:hypothetical protein